MKNKIPLTPIANRLQAIQRHYNLTQRELADRMGLAVGSVNRLLSGACYPSFEAISELFISFPEINANWLVRGDGNMIETESNHIGNNVADIETIAELKTEVWQLKNALQKMVEVMAFLPGRDLGGQPIFPKPSEASKALAKAKCNRKAGLSMFRKGSFRMPVGQA